MKRVIIAEDVHSALKEEKSFLGRSDISIEEASSNAIALRMHRETPADLIIAKLDDRQLSGEKLCSFIRRDASLRNVSIIIVCSGGEADLQRCMDCSANAFVSSPLNTAILLQEAYQLLNIAQRTFCRIKVALKLEGTAKGRPFSAQVENISAAGMLLRSSAELMEGDSIIVSFSIPDTGRVSATAEVVRVLQKKRGEFRGYGISFVDIGPGALAAIEALAGCPGKDTKK